MYIEIKTYNYTHVLYLSYPTHVCDVFNKFNEIVLSIKMKEILQTV